VEAELEEHREEHVKVEDIPKRTFLRQLFDRLVWEIR
jgi:hypothetical protein